MNYFSASIYYKSFENHLAEWEFREQIFNKWLNTLKAGDKMEVIRPNHTRRNNSSAYFNQGICEVLEIKKDEVTFLKSNGKKLHYKISDFQIETNRYFYESAKELLS